ncbi:MAG: ABC transporter permease, partial [Lachnospiraceae bacterium]|nr:ABC transporter permease [Lachnospiraceae bacterium]
RTILTVMGVSIAVAILFTILTLFFSNFINERDKVREQADYEMVFFPETDEQLAGVVNSELVKSVYNGRYYDVASAGYVDGAVFVNTKNPFRINKYYEKLTDKYGIKGNINQELAAYYLQGDTGNDVYITFILFFFIAVIFAVVTVGIIRNSIQLNMIEQIKDYGILRCIGATKWQLRTIIFVMGFIQEITGLIFGMVLGLMTSFVIGKISGIKVGLHIIPILFVLVAFLGDLYFVMDENSKTVRKISPVDAVRGNLKAGQSKIKRRKGSIFGRVFGVDGEYAYKSLMANKGRFYKSVATFSLGIAVCITLSVVISSANRQEKQLKKNYGEYQLFFYQPLDESCDIESAKSVMPPYDVLDEIARDGSVSAVKPIYFAMLYVADYENYINKYDKEYLKYINEELEFLFISDYWETAEDMVNYSKINIYGCDEEEMKKYEDLLLEGTLDVSENGIVIVKQNLLPEGNGGEWIDVWEADYHNVTDYKLGDTISIVDYQMVRNSYVDFLKKLPKDGTRYEHRFEESVLDLIDKKMYKTYVVEGIVEYNKDKLELWNSGNAPQFYLSALLPLDSYLDAMGLGMEDSNGIKYKLGSKLSDKIINLMSNEAIMYSYCNHISDYVQDKAAAENTKKKLLYIQVFAVFMFIVITINIINTSAGNLYIRRQELAQLRVIGVSKKRLCRIVWLEGIITAIIANVIGWILGFGFINPIRSALNAIYGAKLSYPVIAAILGLVISIIVLCGSVYFPIKRMSNGVLDNLNAGGD